MKKQAWTSLIAATACTLAIGCVSTDNTPDKSGSAADIDDRIGFHHRDWMSAARDGNRDGGHDGDERHHIRDQQRVRIRSEGHTAEFGFDNRQHSGWSDDDGYVGQHGEQL